MKRYLPHLRTLLMSILLVNLFTICTYSQTKKISLQGFLKDANGKAVADGQQSITFKLYPTLSGGTAEWSEDQSVNVFGGVYSTNLGTNANTVSGGVTDFGNLSWGSKTYFVGLTIQGTELTPRTELTFAPYSLGSPFAEKANTVVCSGAVGDVKYSILNPTQFAAVNGNCWVPMDGGSMAGSKLAAIIGGNNVPNAGGLFLRGQEAAGATNHDPDRDSNTPIATFQEQSFLSHSHSGTTDSRGGDYLGLVLTNTTYGNNGPFEEGRGSPDYGYNSFYLYAPNHAHNLNINSNGGNETRPKNLNLWTYIRIN